MFGFSFSSQLRLPQRNRSLWRVGINYTLNPQGNKRAIDTRNSRDCKFLRILLHISDPTGSKALFLTLMVESQ
ncbi:hypothetical protein ACE1CB_35555 [Aerosakkonema sp. BLCC-F2]